MEYSNNMSCVECRKDSKYKCPSCRQPYCSVSCCKKHKLKPCLAPSQVPEQPIEGIKEPSNRNYEFPSEDTVPPEKLNLLAQSADVKQCLRNRCVREILEILDKSPHPDQLMQEYMIEPIFTEFVDACLKVVQPHDGING